MRQDLETLAAAAAAVQTALLLVAAVIAWRSLRASRAAAKYEAVVRYFERYWSTDFIDTVNRALMGYGLPPPADAAAARAQLAKYKSAPYADKLSVHRVLNFFEELGILYDAGVLDNKLLLSMFGGHSIQMWRQFSWLVEEGRGLGGDRIFDKWEILEKAAEKRDMELKAKGK